MNVAILGLFSYLFFCQFVASMLTAHGKQKYPVCRSKLALIYRCSLLASEFVCVEVLRPSQPNGVMSSAVSLPNHIFTGQA